LRSIDFDPWLRVEDMQGKVLGQNDNISAEDRTSRLGFVAPRAGTYRLVVTSPASGWVGEYQLEVAALQPDGEPQVLRDEPTGQGGPWQLQVLTARPGSSGHYTLRLRAYQGDLRAGPSEHERLGLQARQLNARVVELYGAGRTAEATALSRQALALRQQLYP